MACAHASCVVAIGACTVSPREALPLRHHLPAAVRRGVARTSCEHPMVAGWPSEKKCRLAPGGRNAGGTHGPSYTRVYISLSLGFPSSFSLPPSLFLRRSGFCALFVGIDPCVHRYKLFHEHTTWVCFLILISNGISGFSRSESIDARNLIKPTRFFIIMYSCYYHQRTNKYFGKAFY